MLVLQEMLQANEKDRALRVERELLEGLLGQYLNLFTEKEHLKRYSQRLRFGPVMLESLMKLVGGEIA